ncbi:MAG: 4-hydroxy-tetrahydrodipicolinate reductase [Clostridia bacterium]|nr:4-hydroxy-tetrahydrodipicolinate reductase [Clostridia bacterium]
MKDVKIILTGAAGRMGKAVFALSENDERVSVIAAVDVCPAQSSVPFYNGIGELSTSLGADVIVDFSHHTAIEGILSYARAAHCAVVICTTGHTERELELIDEASKEIAVFRSGNMSLGINLLMSLVKKAAATLDGFDIEIIEKHHNQKLDAPSGTAIMLADAARSGVEYQAQLVYDRHSTREKREKTEIGMHSVRGGNIVGEHEVIFAGHDEIVTLSHSARSREVFARGALSAAAYMKGKRAGKYSMSDVIESIVK